MASFKIPTSGWKLKARVAVAENPGNAMILPLQVSFRNMKPSEAVEARIREEMAKLDRFYQSIMCCRVVVELPHKHRKRGDLYHVRIDMTVPGAELVIKREPSLHASLRQSDDEKQVKSYEAHAAHKDVFVVHSGRISNKRGGSCRTMRVASGVRPKLMLLS